MHQLHPQSTGPIAGDSATPSASASAETFDAHTIDASDLNRGPPLDTPLAQSLNHIGQALQKTATYPARSRLLPALQQTQQAHGAMIAHHALQPTTLRYR